MTYDFHMDDLTPPDLPETCFEGFQSFGPARDMCERTISGKIARLFHPEIEAKRCFRTYPSFGATEDRKATKKTFGKVGSREVGRMKVFCDDYRSGKALLPR